ncbi:MAG TPA: tetratricopeptide repeat protein, partial [Kofleriaceae bacterium]|nr:tetratricopeptide repeat protein [Kofleriaceae bacterium]
MALGAVFEGAKRSEEAVAAFEHARRTARDAYGPDSIHEVNTLLALERMFRERDEGAPGARQLRETTTAIFRKLGTPLPPYGDQATPSSTIATLEPIVEQTHRLEPDTEDEANAIWGLGHAYYLAGRVDRALEQYRRAAEMYDRLKVRTSAAVDAHARIAQLVLEAGQLGEARREIDRAVALAEAIAVKTDIAYALTLQGEVRLAQGDVAGAREVLKRALQIRIDLRAPATQIGNTQFQYARALWKVDRRQAIDLATSARVLIKSYIDSDVPEMEQAYVLSVQKQRLAEINRWLDEHRR